MQSKNYDTIKYYDDNASLYFDQTVDADLSRPHERFLSRLTPGSYILDFGCGSGRDSKYFLGHGYRVRATDGSAELCKIASKYIGQPVDQLLFEDLDEQEIYDGIWSCCAILHIEKEKLPAILRKMLNALKPNGIIYASFKKGEGHEIKEGKYYNFMTKQNMEQLLEQLNLNARLIECFETTATSKRPLNGYTWNNFLIQKILNYYSARPADLMKNQVTAFSCSGKTVTKDHQESSIPDDQVNPDLRAYIETYIFPEYSKNEWGHQIGHINYVIRRSLNFAKVASAQLDDPLNVNIVYTVAAYHDLGHHIDAANHEKVSAQMLREDEKLKQFFSPSEIKTIAEAIEDHRSHRKNPPRSVYGKIIASADCNINIDVMLHRTCSYRLRNFDSSSLEDVINNSRQHLIDKYGKNGFANNKMFFDDPEFDNTRRELQALTANEELFRKRFLKVNHLECSYELEKQLSNYLAKVNPDLRAYVEAKIFPEYSKNDLAHGILHIREVVRRAFVLDDSFSLHLNPNLIYAIAAYHDLGKHIDSEHHEIISAELFQKDKKVTDYFSDQERQTITEAIEDHRSSKFDHPRSIYGKLISSADRNTRIEQVFIRSFFVSKDRHPQVTVAESLDSNFKRLSKRYSEADPENMFFADQEYLDFLTEIRQLLQDEAAFKNRYCEINQISSRDHTLAEEPGVKISPIILI